MKVSIIMPTFQQERFIEDALDGIYNQNYKNIELIIVAVYSDTKTWKIVKKLKKRGSVTSVKKIVSNYAHITHQMNLGLFSATGKYMMFHASDDKYCSSGVVREIVNVSTKKEAILVYFGFYFTDYMLHNHKPIVIKDNISDVSFVKRKAMLRFAPLRFSDGGRRTNRVWDDIRQCNDYKNKIAFIKKPMFFYRQHAGEIHRHKRNSQKLFTYVIWGQSEDAMKNHASIKRVSSVKKINRDDYCVYFFEPEACLSMWKKLLFKRLIVHWSKENKKLMSKFSVLPHIHHVCTDVGVLQQIKICNLPNVRYFSSLEEIVNYLNQEIYSFME